MSVRLRLQRHGANKRPFYRVVAADQRAPRDGAYIELLGTYDPLQDPGLIRLKSDRVDYWIGVGAQPSDTVRALIKRLKAGDAIDLSAENADKTALKARLESKKKNISSRRAAAATKHAEAAKKADAVKAKTDAEAKAKVEEAKAADAKPQETKAEEAPATETPAVEAPAKETKTADEAPAAEEAAKKE